MSVALAAARAAAALHVETTGTLPPSRWGEKDPSDFVTEVDEEAERLIVAAILEQFPTHRVLAEEGTGSAAGDREPGVLWIIDPLDGTTNWLHGYPEYAVSIAALDRRGLRVGVVINSARGEEFVGVRGAGATLNGKPIRVSAVSELRLGLIGTGFPFKKTELIPGYLPVLGTVLERTSGVRRGGAAALDLCHLACGRLDAFWEHWLMPWDVAAGALIVAEAGGTFGSLPVAEGHPLAGPARGGAETAAVFFEGRAQGMGAGSPVGFEPRPGAFMAGNGLVDDAFEELLRTLLG